MLFSRRKAKCFGNVTRNQGVVFEHFWQHILLGRNNDHVLKVQATCYRNPITCSPVSGSPLKGMVARERCCLISLAKTGVLISVEVRDIARCSLFRSFLVSRTTGNSNTSFAGNVSDPSILSRISRNMDSILPDLQALYIKK